MDARKRIVTCRIVAIRFSLVLASLAALLICIALAFTEKVDDGYVIFVGSSVIDPRGKLDELKNRMTRNCEKIVTVPLDSIEAKHMGDNVARITNGGNPTLKLFLANEEWAIVESEFEAAEPAALLMRRSGNQYEIEKAWGGSAAPFLSAPEIRKYFSSVSGAPPINLIRCYEPSIAPFGDES